MTTRLEHGAPDAETPAGDRWTVREIHQQPRLWRKVAELVAGDRERIDGFLAPLLARADLRVVFTGAGTSAFAGEVLAPALSQRLARRIDAVATTDLVSNPTCYLAEQLPTLLVSFARSGDSPESLAATQLADQLLEDCWHLIVTCNREGALNEAHERSDRSLVLVLPDEAHDRGFAMTSSFTTMVLAALLSLTPDAADAVPAAAEAAEHVLARHASAASGVADLEPSRIVVLGSGPLKGLAREASLKVLELTAGAIPTWFDSSLGFRHGPKSILDDGTLVVVFLSNDAYTRQYDLDIVAELSQSVSADRLLVVAPTGTQLPGGTLWDVAAADGLPDEVLALPYVVVPQLIALQASRHLGKDPDNPFPSRVVNRVVQGVRVHPFPAS